ncbi:hypothetical protein ACFY1J_24050 [Streptomyces sp. NPDC001406]|uniref:hypothetical protein n=1 Tax=Streptomyces sp. NPDC001406 TaxID=3364572 RepID=UPI00369FFD97
MAAFATSGDLAAFLEDDGLNLATAELVLTAVSDEIRDALGWSVTQQAAVVETVDGPGTADLLLPTLHLTAVASVVEDGKTLAYPADYLWYERGKLTRMSGGEPIAWTGKRQGVVITHTHGYPDGAVPGVFRTVTLETAGRLAGNPGGLLKSRTVGRVAVAYADVRAAAAGVGDDPRLDFYRLPEGF